MLVVYNTLSNAKEPFEPLEAGRVRMYVCGVTVYDYCHLGHARVMVVFDVIYRHLRYLGYDVTYVRNITDIDDKIINRSNEAGEEYFELTRRFINAMHEDADALGVLRPDKEPCATETIEEMLVMIDAPYLKLISFIAVIASTVQLVEMFIKKASPALFRALGIFLPLITINCAILAVALFQTNKGYGFFQSVAYALGAGVGFTLALVLMAGLREKLELAETPEMVKGTAITLVLAGLLSICFMGFAGLFS